MHFRSIYYFLPAMIIAPIHCNKIIILIFPCLSFAGLDALAYDPHKFAMDYHSIGFREAAGKIIICQKTIPLQFT